MDEETRKGLDRMMAKEFLSREFSGNNNNYIMRKLGYASKEKGVPLDVLTDYVEVTLKEIHADQLAALRKPPMKWKDIRR